MSPAEIVTLTLAALLALTALGILARGIGWRPARRRRQVIVPLRSGETLRGVLIARRLDHLELADVEVLTATSKEAVRADGLVWVDRANVTWVQVL